MVLTTIVTAVLAADGPNPTPREAMESMIIAEGLSKELVAAEPLLEDPIAICFDEQGRMYVAESQRVNRGVEDNRTSPFWLLDDVASQTVEDRLSMYERWADQREGGMAYYSQYDDRIRRLEDIDGDGVFDTSTIFADGFNTPLDGLGSGLLAIDGDLWYTNIPHLWRLRDTDDDGIADERTSVYQGFGVRIALLGHDMHGLALGLDGRIYWSIGDRGYHLETDNGTMHSPGSGAVFRSERDGSGIEVFHHGLRNPQELAFDEYGNLFTGDNNSDAGDKARLVYCVDGGETGWRMEYQTLEGDNLRGPWVQENAWDPAANDRSAWLLPAVATIGSGPSGLVAYPGRGLTDRYDDHFFMCDFRGAASYSDVLSFAVEPKGAGFEMIDLHPFAEDVLCTDVDFGYDGRIYVSDWGWGWGVKNVGRVYAIWDGAKRSGGDVSAIFADGFDDRLTDELVSMLGHADRRVRLRAQYALADRGAANSLAGLLHETDQRTRIHAMWGLAMIDRDGSDTMDLIMPLLGDNDAEIRAQAAKIIGESGATNRAKDILPLIDDPSPRVAFFAAIAAGTLGDHDAVPLLLDLARRNADADPYLRHAAVVGLSRSATAEDLSSVASAKESSTRLAAALALRTMEDPIVAVYLQDVDPAIATEAARAIHDMPITGAMADLAASLSRACTLPWQRRAISAAERLGTDSGLAGLVDFASNEANPESMRLLALDVLRTWRDPPPRERVEGTWRPVDFSPRSADLLKDRLFALLPSATGPVLAAALQTALSHDVPVPRDLAASLLADPEQDIAVRVHCLRHLSDATTIESSLTNENEMIRAAARDLLFDSNRDRATALLVHAIETGSLRESQAAVLTLGRDEDALANITPQDLPVELWVEYEEASGNPVAFGDPNEGWWLSRGGDPDRGKELFHNHPHAQCLRCHAVGGVGGISGPALDGVASRLDEWSLQQSLLVPGAVISEGYGEYSTMPPMGMLLDHRELRDVMAWLQLLK